MTSGHAPTELIADYAAGALAEGMSLLVASHLTYCPCCADRLARLEALGGALLAQSEAVAPDPRCLEGALARIERPAPAKPAAAPPRAPLPAPLCRRLDRPVSDLVWRPLVPGIAAFWLEGFPTERVGLIRAQPGARMRAHDHAGPEATLVLAGRMRDRDRVYCCGEMAFADAGVEHAPEAVGREACLCMLVQSGEARAGEHGG